LLEFLYSFTDQAHGLVRQYGGVILDSLILAFSRPVKRVNSNCRETASKSEAAESDPRIQNARDLINLRHQHWLIPVE
jgi:hypothetical protein